MRKTLFSSVICGLAGIIFGCVIAIRTFDIEVDLLSIPYHNEAVEITRDIVIEQGDITISIPQGTTLIRRSFSSEYRGDEYMLYVGGSIGGANAKEIFIETDRLRYFRFR